MEKIDFVSLRGEAEEETEKNLREEGGEGG